MKLSLAQTQMLNQLLDSGKNTIHDDLAEFIAAWGYDESNDPDLDYYTETIIYEHRGSTLKGEN